METVEPQLVDQLPNFLCLLVAPRMAMLAAQQKPEQQSHKFLNILTLINRNGQQKYHLQRFYFGVVEYQHDQNMKWEGMARAKGYAHFHRCTKNLTGCFCFKMQLQEGICCDCDSRNSNNYNYNM